MDSVEENMKKMTWWYRRQRLIATQQGPFHLATLRSEGRLITCKEMFAFLQEKGLDKRTWIRWVVCFNTLSVVHSVAFEAKIKCAHVPFVFYTFIFFLCLTHTETQCWENSSPLFSPAQNAFLTPASLFWTKISLELDQVRVYERKLSHTGAYARILLCFRLGIIIF